MATFNSVPTELRLLIWSFTVEPRIVEVCLDSPSCTRKSSPSPAIMSVCHESRLIGEQYYEKMTGPTRYVWVNYGVDTISFGRCLIDLIGVDQAKRVKRLQLERQNNEFWFHFESKHLRLYRNLIETHLICTDQLVDWYDAIDMPFLGREEGTRFTEKATGKTMTYQEIKEAYCKQQLDWYLEYIDAED